MSFKQEDVECNRQLGMFFGNFTVEEIDTTVSPEAIRLLRKLCSSGKTNQDDLLSFFTSRNKAAVVLDKMTYEMFVSHPVNRHWYSIIWVGMLNGPHDAVVWMNIHIQKGVIV